MDRNLSNLIAQPFSKNSFGLRAFLTGSFFIIIGVGYWIWDKRRRGEKPWVQVGTISEIFIYPIKSCKGITVPDAECLKLGLQKGVYFDRCFVVTDNEGKFITAREKPKLVLIAAKLENTTVTLTAPGLNTVRADLRAVVAKRKPVRARMWFDMPIEAFDCGQEISDWLTKYLDKADGACQEYRLMYHPPDLKLFNSRSLNNYEKFRGLFGKRNDKAIFPDLTPFMLMTDASMADLNERVPAGEQFSIRNFRPNFVVTGTKAYDEDNWARVRIGDETLFTNVKGCTRCILTTVNWAMGEKHPKSEPLKTLSRYRRAKTEEEKKYYGASPVFGVNLALDQPGAVKEGDAVYVQYKRQ